MRYDEYNNATEPMYNACQMCGSYTMNTNATNARNLSRNRYPAHQLR
jgi:hypothetical protein